MVDTPEPLALLEGGNADTEEDTETNAQIAEIDARIAEIDANTQQEAEQYQILTRSRSQNREADKGLTTLAKQEGNSHSTDTLHIARGTEKANRSRKQSTSAPDLTSKHVQFNETGTAKASVAANLFTNIKNKVRDITSPTKKTDTATKPIPKTTSSAHEQTDTTLVDDTTFLATKDNDNTHNSDTEDFTEDKIGASNIDEATSPTNSEDTGLTEPNEEETNTTTNSTEGQSSKLTNILTKIKEQITATFSRDKEDNSLEWRHTNREFDTSPNSDDNDKDEQEVEDLIDYFENLSASQEREDRIEASRRRSSIKETNQRDSYIAPPALLFDKTKSTLPPPLEKKTGAAQGNTCTPVESESNDTQLKAFALSKYNQQQGIEEENRERNRISQQARKEDSDTDSDDHTDNNIENEDMAYTTPVVFRGTSSENAQQWITHARWWLDTLRISQTGTLRQQLHQIAILFQEEARNWFARLRIRDTTGGISGSGNSLSAATSRREAINRSEEISDERARIETQTPDGRGEPEITSWQDFEDRFLERFKRRPSQRLADVTALMMMKQAMGQTIEEYVAGMRRQGTLVGATDQELFMATITGLRTDIKFAIMQFDPSTLEEVVARGQTAERFLVPSTSFNQQLQGVNQLENREMAEQDKLSIIISAINNLGNGTGRAEAAQRTERPGTPPPSRVRFESPERTSERKEYREADTTTEKSGRPQRSTSRDRDSQYNSRERYTPPPAQQSRGGGYYEERERTPTPQNQQFQRSADRQNGVWRTLQRNGSTAGRGGYQATSPRNNYSSNYQPYSRPNNMNNNERCSNCNFEQHVNGRCPAVGTRCTNCGRPNHWARCCRAEGGAARGGYRQSPQPRDN